MIKSIRNIMEFFKFKHKKFTLIFILLAGMFLSSCNKNTFSYVKDENVKVVLVDNQKYEILDHTQQAGDSAHIAVLKRGEDVTFKVKVNTNLYLKEIDYQDSEINFLKQWTYDVVIKNVLYNSRVNLTIEEIGDNDGLGLEKHIAYDCNGGTAVKSTLLFPYSTAHHPRPNTSIGTDIMQRTGYTLIGWNTKADGTGQHIGLGSRYLDLNNYIFTLYAEWAKQDPINSFEYILDSASGTYAITKYKGDNDIVCIPGLIDRKPVTIIKALAFWQAECRTVILPRTIKQIEDNAFKGCALEELYYYDNIERISDSCFIGCDNFKTVHINAIQKPRYAKADRHSPYADKIDNLIVHQNEKKIVILGGSGSYYNVDACRLKELFPSYEPYNIAVNGWFNGQMQFEIAMTYLGKDDVFLHVSETIGRYQLMTQNDMGHIYEENGLFDSRYFNCLELNYDLIALADLRHVTRFFDSFNSYNTVRTTKEGVEYSDYTIYADIRGDYTHEPGYRVTHKPKDGMLSTSKEAAIDCTSFSEEGLAELCGYYHQMQNKGVSIYFSFGCVNRSALSEEDLSEENISTFEEGIKKGIGDVVPILTSVSEIIWDISCFSDSDYHLDYKNALVFTDMLAERMALE